MSEYDQNEIARIILDADEVVETKNYTWPQIVKNSYKCIFPEHIVSAKKKCMDPRDDSGNNPIVEVLEVTFVNGDDAVIVMGYLYNE